MSVDSYKFKCPKCRREESHCEGYYLFDDDGYNMLQCPVCKQVKTVKLNYMQGRNKDFPLCCGIKMIEWDKSCPSCGEKMEIKEWESDTI